MIKKTIKRNTQQKDFTVGAMTAQQNNIYGIYIKNYFQILLQMNNYLIL